MDKNSFIPALEQMTDPTMPFVEELCVNAVQLPHSDRQIAIRRFNEEMIVVSHETVAMANPMISPINVLKGVQEVFAVVVILEDRLLLVST